MTFTLRLFNILAALLLACSACALAADRPSGDVIKIEHEGQGCKWEFQTPGKAGMAQIALKLATLDGKPINGKDISGELLMPEMPMPGYPKQLLFSEDGDTGVYTALAQYMHGGFWRVTVKVPCHAGKFFEQSFDFDLQD